mgnify:CR=1 FL=1
MNYQQIYNDLCSEKGKNRNLNNEAHEEHHIVPKCMGGNNNPENLVDLNLREHFIAHRLLEKIYPDHRGLLHGVFRMSANDKYGKINSRTYKYLREKHSNLIWITTGLESKMIPNGNPIPEGWFRGHHYKNKGNKDLIWITDGTESKMIPKNDSIPEGWEKGNRFKECKWITNGVESKTIPKNDPIPDGWERGQHFNKGSKGKQYINNGIKTKTIPKDNAIPEGWERGYHPKRKVNLEMDAVPIEGKLIGEH